MTPVVRAGVLLAGIAMLVPTGQAQDCNHRAESGPASSTTISDGAGVRSVSDQAIASVTVAPCDQGASAVSGNKSADDPRIQPTEKLQIPKPGDFNRQIYYRHKLEFSLDGGWLPINVPFPFDVFEGDPYDLYPLRYTLVPIMASLRLHLGDIWGPPVLRGNWDVTATLEATAIPKGAETHYFSYEMGLRRNFVPRNWKATPYFDMRAGLGLIDAKGPLGVYYAQGQNFTYNLNMGSGVRYNFNPRVGISAGLNWMHISNGNLSAPKYSNYGINVYGPMFGLDWQLRKRRAGSE
jgi:hypothetical protein